MEKNGVTQRQQQFAAQREELESELQALKAVCSSAVAALSAQQTQSQSQPRLVARLASSDTTDTGSASPSVTPATLERMQQQIVRLLYRIAMLCGEHEDYALAAQYYCRVLEWLDTRECARQQAASSMQSLSSSPLLSTKASASNQAAPALARTESTAFAESRHGDGRAGGVGAGTDTNAGINTSITGTDTTHSNNTPTGTADAPLAFVFALAPPPPPPLTDSDKRLKENVLNNLAAMHFGTGERSDAMSCILDAKKLVRDRMHAASVAGADSDNASRHANADLDLDSNNNNRTDVLQTDAAHNDALVDRDFEQALVANYALFLYTHGSRVDDAIHAATSVIDERTAERPGSAGYANTSSSDSSSRVTSVRARATALSLLATCYKTRGNDDDAIDFARQAAQLAEYAQDPALLARTHSNVAMLCFAQQDVATALHHLLTAYSAAQSAHDLAQQAVVTYHIGLVVAALEVASVEMPQSPRSESLDRDMKSSTEHTQVLRSASTSGSLTATEDTAPPSTLSLVSTLSVLTPTTTFSANDCFVQSETLARALPAPDVGLALLAFASRCEHAYDAGAFGTAETECSLALEQLHELMAVSSSNDTHASHQHQQQTLVNGKFNLAEATHQRDLDLALAREDIHAQQRATRNLALVASVTQQHSEAIAHWREVLEIAKVLQSKADEMVACVGLGTAVMELSLSDLQDQSDIDPLQLFQRQRLLAVELGDQQQQIIAQRNIVRVHESPSRLSDLETRLAECDALVQLCEQYGDCADCADAYRMLANALTAQLTRLRVRGARFAEAVAVLSHKRNAMCVKYKQTVEMAAAAIVGSDDRDDAGVVTAKDKSPLQLAKRYSRARITRVDVLER